MPFSEDHAQYAVNFIEKFCTHTNGQWAAQPFTLLDWQSKIVRDVFGTLKSNGYRQYTFVYIEIPKKNGKSDLGAAIALKLLAADNEPGAEIYSAAADRKQAGIVFNVAAQMIRQNRVLDERCSIIDSLKHITLGNSSYQVLSSEAYSKHGYNVSGLIFDELHTQPNRELYDVLTKGSGDARRQPLYWIMTTAGIDRNSIAWEVHQKAEQILKGIIEEPTWYPVIYALEDTEDWESEENWRKVNPSIGYIIDFEKVKDAYRSAKESPADESSFRQLRLNQWITSSSRWMPLSYWDACKDPVQPFVDRTCYLGLDLSSRSDLTAMALVATDGEYYDIEMTYWIPKDTARQKERKDKVPYMKWTKEGYVIQTDGDVIDYDGIKVKLIEYLSKYKIREIGFDPWNANKLLQDLEKEGLVTSDPKEAKDTGKILLVEMRQGWKTLSPATKDAEVAIKTKKVRHGGNPVLRWNVDNVVLKVDPADNVKPDKAKSTQRIDGVLAMLMGMSRANKYRDEDGPSIYETRGF